MISLSAILSIFPYVTYDSTTIEFNVLYWLEFLRVMARLDES